jgi:hypothetical protein
VNAWVATLFGAALAPLLFGAGIVQTLGLSPRDGRRAFLAWSYLIGQFAAAWLTLAWLCCHRTVPGWTLPIAIAIAGTALLVLRRADGGPATRDRNANRVAAWASVLLAILIAERCSSLNLAAILESDEANVWSAKARALFAPGSLAAWGHAGYVQGADYPLFNPLVQVLAFATVDRQLFWENRLPIQGFAIALVLLLADALQRRTNVWIAFGLLTAVTTSVFLHVAPTVYADVMLALSLLAVVVAWCDWQHTRAPHWWRLCCLAAGALVATKNEGRMLLAAFAVALLGARMLQRPPPLSAPRPSRWWLAIPLVALAAGTIWNRTQGLANDITTVDPGDARTFLERVVHWAPVRVGPILERFWRLATDGAVTRWLPTCVLAVPLLAGRTWRRTDVAVPLAVFVAAMVGYGAAFLGVTAIHPGSEPAVGKLFWHMDAAADRLFLQVLPIAAITLAAAFGRRATNRQATQQALSQRY